MSSNDYGEPVSPVRRAWENGGRQYYEERTRQAAKEASVIDHSGQMDVCTPVRRHYATSPGYTLREREYLVRSGQLDGGLAAPAGWREPHRTIQPAPRRAVLEECQPAAAVAPAPRPIVYAQYDPAFDQDLHTQPVPAQTVPTASHDQSSGQAPARGSNMCCGNSHSRRATDENRERIFAQLREEYQAKKYGTRSPATAAPSVQPLPADDPDDDELPPDMTPAEWLAQRHVVSVARKTLADPASVSYVPVQEEEPQLVVTPAGFRYTADRFSYLEIKR